MTGGLIIFFLRGTLKLFVKKKKRGEDFCMIKNFLENFKKYFEHAKGNFLFKGRCQSYNRICSVYFFCVGVFLTWNQPYEKVFIFFLDVVKPPDAKLLTHWCLLLQRNLDLVKNMIRKTIRKGGFFTIVALFFFFFLLEIFVFFLVCV